MVKHLTRSLHLTFAFAVLAMFGAVMWLHADVRSLEWARPTIESALNPPHAPYTIHYSQANIDWRDWSKLGLLEVRDVTVAGADGAIFAKFPAIYVSFSPFGILTHGRMLHTILLQQPKLFLTRDANHIVRLGLDSDANAAPITNFLAFFADDTSAADTDPTTNGGVNLQTSLPFRILEIDGADVTFTDAITNTIITSANTHMHLARSSGELDATVAIPFVYNNVAGRIDASLRGSSNRQSQVVNASLAQVPASFACILFTCPAGMQVAGEVSGNVAVGLDNNAQPTAADINVSAQHARFTAPTLFAEPLEIDRAQLQLHAGNGLQNVHLAHLSLGLEDVGFEITGTARRDNAGWFADAQARGTRPLALAKLYKYWPLPLAPDSRAWVLASMKAGRGDQLSLTLHLTPPDWNAPVLPDTAIDAGLLAQDITAEYLTGFPLMHHVNAQVHFTGTTARVDANSGTAMTATQLQHALIVFPDLNKPGTPVEINANLHAPAADAATILALKYFPFAKPLQLDPAAIGGTVDTVMKLKFDAFSHDGARAQPAPAQDIDFSHVIYDIAANLHEVAQKKFAGKFNVAAVNGALTATNAGLHIDSDLLLNSLMPFTVAVDQKSGGDVEMDVNGVIARGLFSQLGLPENDRIVEGTARVDAKITAQKNTVILRRADVDLSDLALDISELSWSKKRGVAGALNLRSDGAEYLLNVNADDLRIADARAQVDADGALVSASAPRIISARNDFSASYQTRADGFTVALTGKKLDASASYAKSDNGLLKDFPPIHLTLDLGELVLMEANPFQSVKGSLLCSRQRCDTANIHALVGKGNLSATIAQKAGMRQLQVTSNDAGSVMRALNFTDRVFGGALDIHGAYDDRKTPPLFAGAVSITDFTVKNSPILGRIFAIGSLTGLQNALTGSGIAFDKMLAQISEQGGVFTVKDGRANGNAAGLTVSGTIDTTTANLKLKGVVVPAYALNSLIGKIPIIGAIAGGDGEGLIAFNYRIDGLYSDPNVSVNPLSGLTPGFLRGIFGIFDSDEKKPASKPLPETKSAAPAAETAADAPPAANADAADSAPPPPPDLPARRR